jgi:hypothetical protein
VLVDNVRKDIRHRVARRADAHVDRLCARRDAIQQRAQPLKWRAHQRAKIRARTIRAH